MASCWSTVIGMIPEDGAVVIANGKRLPGAQIEAVDMAIGADKIGSAAKPSRSLVPRASAPEKSAPVKRRASEIRVGQVEAGEVAAVEVIVGQVAFDKSWAS